MQQKEIRIALVCYGGVSLAVYMHGVTKELWHLARASRDYHADAHANGGVERVYRDLLQWIERERGLKLRVLPDILTGASAGGINAVFLAQAVHSGQSLEPLTEMWLDYADVDELVDPDARPVWRFAKFWAQPIAWWLLRRPGNVISESVASETRSEVRRKVSAFIRGRWFQPPFSGAQFSHLIHKALKAMERVPVEAPLLPPGHPLDLLVTATDFYGHREMLRLHSPPVVEETEHRLPISFVSHTPSAAGANLAHPLELTLAARATASFPGAFPALRIEEIEELGWSSEGGWPGRDVFLKRVMPAQYERGTIDEVSLIDGSVLVNAPFAGAMAGLRTRPVQREVDRRFVYIDPRPDRLGSDSSNGKDRTVSFFAAIFGSLSTIPREQPIRDNLEAIERQSREAARNQQIVKALRPDVERAVESLFGRTLFLDRPSPRRLRIWRAKAQQAAANEAGYAFQSYAQAKFSGIVEELAELILAAAPTLDLADARPIELALREELARRGLSDLSAPGGGLKDEAIAFFRVHDIRFRIRRMRLLTRRLARDWEALEGIDETEIEQARRTIYAILSLYFERETVDHLGDDFRTLAANVLQEPGMVLDRFAERRLLPEVDERAEAILSEALVDCPRELRRPMLLTYLGFPYYDAATYPLQRNDVYTEYDPVKVDRISPDDAKTIRAGGTRATLRGIEFYNFGAFFSRAYRENDYLWGRLHGAERMIDIVCSAVEGGVPEADARRFKLAAFDAIIGSERERLKADPSMLERVRRELATLRRKQS